MNWREPFRKRLEREESEPPREIKQKPPSRQQRRWYNRWGRKPLGRRD